ncbi:MAG: hypothetical protein GMKNLPBB_02107 [Myxococcota bacterium]|nr:hypothetical protein [Myxococcota bacterium]
MRTCRELMDELLAAIPAARLAADLPGQGGPGRGGKPWDRFAAWAVGGTPAFLWTGAGGLLAASSRLLEMAAAGVSGVVVVDLTAPLANAGGGADFSGLSHAAALNLPVFSADSPRALREIAALAWMVSVHDGVRCPVLVLLDPRLPREVRQAVPALTDRQRELLGGAIGKSLPVEAALEFAMPRTQEGVNAAAAGLAGRVQASVRVHGELAERWAEAGGGVWRRVHAAPDETSGVLELRGLDGEEADESVPCLTIRQWFPPPAREELERLFPHPVKLIIREPGAAHLFQSHQWRVLAVSSPRNWTAELAPLTASAAPDQRANPIARAAVRIIPRTGSDGAPVIRGVTARSLTDLPKRIPPGHFACPGCGIFTALDSFLKAVPGEVILLWHTGCGVVTAGLDGAQGFAAHSIHLPEQGAAEWLQGLLESGALRHAEDGLLPIVISGDQGFAAAQDDLKRALRLPLGFIWMVYDNLGGTLDGEDFSSSDGGAMITKLERAANLAPLLEWREQGADFAAALSESHYRDLLKRAAICALAARAGKKGVVRLWTHCTARWGHAADAGRKVLECAVHAGVLPVYHADRYGISHWPPHPPPQDLRAAGELLRLLDLGRRLGETVLQERARAICQAARIRNQRWFGGMPAAEP